MQDDGYVLLDGRVFEKGWLHVMRLRLTGRVPIQVAKTCLKLGLLDYCWDKGLEDLRLTSLGAKLTDPGPASFTVDNCDHVARSMLDQGFQLTWFSVDERKELCRGKGTEFGQVYHDMLTAGLARASALPGLKDNSRV
ncbi:hypothetical protein ACN2XU_22500 [Primorskyibacter sp. 2E107]|uniref:hypothetical protein n=1 Tax=Primorskyibacter sp. 2E107 TaxID=3403458 RepID=UPI003AF90D9A